MVHLPEEILERICSHLRTDAEKHVERKTKLATLLNVSLASKTFNRIARPEIYHTIDLINHIERLRPLLSIILSQPKLDALVREIHVGNRETHRREDVSYHVEPKLEVPVERLPPSQRLREGLLQRLKEGFEDAELAVLLSLCYKLEVLHFYTPFEDTLVSRVMAEGLAVAPSSLLDEDDKRPFRHIRDVHVEHCDTEYASGFDELIPLLKLPALHTLRGWALQVDEGMQSAARLTSTVKRILLEDSLVDAEGLEGLLPVCPALEVLSIHWGSATVGDCEMDFDRMAAAINRHGSRLRTLILRPEEAEGDERRSSLGSLKSLRELRVLEIWGPVLFGYFGEDDRPPSTHLVDILPCTLNTLEITPVDDEHAELQDEMFWTLMNDGRYQELTTIRVNRNKLFSQDLAESDWDDSESNNFWDDESWSSSFWIVLKREAKKPS